MTPKEKGKELVALFEYEYNLGIADNTGIEGIDKKKAKQCAFIAVDEILNTGTLGILLEDYYQEVKKAVKKMLLNSEIYEKADSQSVYTKRELNLLQKKVERSRKIISGIEKLSYPIGALIVTDVVKDKVAVKEALRMGIPIIGLVDTNANPTGITVVIPCNDDLEKSISAVCIHLAEAIKKGKATFEAQHKIEAEKALLEKEEEQKKRNAAQKASFEKR